MLFGDNNLDKADTKKGCYSRKNILCNSPLMFNALNYLLIHTKQKDINYFHLYRKGTSDND